MGLTTKAKKALDAYIQQAKKTKSPQKLTIYDAVTLTEVQRLSIAECLKAYWNRTNYECPATLNLNPKHGYESRVFKDRFLPEQFGEWMERGCVDTAEVATDPNGRPHLIVRNNRDFPRYTYNIVITIRSDSHGSVQIDDVIPRGLPAGAKK